MRKWLAMLGAVALLATAVPAPAAAGSSEDAALALGAFAVFNQLLRGETIFHNGFRAHETVIVHQAPTVFYAPPPPPTVVYAPPPAVIYYTPPPAVFYAPAPPPVVVYPNGGWSPGYVSVPARHHKSYKHFKKHRHDDDDDD